MGHWSDYDVFSGFVGRVSVLASLSRRLGLDIGRAWPFQHEVSGLDFGGRLQFWGRWRESGVYSSNSSKDL